MWPIEIIGELTGKSSKERGDVIKAILSNEGIGFSLDRSVGIENIVVSDTRNPRIVFSCHYDVFTLEANTPGANTPEAFISPGANDNGSGVAVCINLAEMLRGKLKNIGYEICFFDREEDGCVGSKIHVSTVDKNEIIGAVNLDMVGIGSAMVFSGDYLNHGTRLLDILEKQAALQGAESRRLLRYVSSTSDHQPYNDWGIEAYTIECIWPSDLAEIDKYNTAFFSQEPGELTMPNIRHFRLAHSYSDEAYTLSYPSIANSINLAYNTAIAVDKLFAGNDQNRIYRCGLETAFKVSVNHGRRNNLNSWHSGECGTAALARTTHGNIGEYISLEEAVAKEKPGKACDCLAIRFGLEVASYAVTHGNGSNGTIRKMKSYLDMASRLGFDLNLLVSRALGEMQDGQSDSPAAQYLRTLNF